jgi:hypothetical protein
VSRAINYQSLEKFIKSYLSKNGITLEEHIFEGHRRKVTQSEFAKDLADEIYKAKPKLHDLVGERAVKVGDPNDAT